MPASSISGLNSWVLYISGWTALVLLLTPQLAGGAKDARASADWRNVDGVRAVVDSLRPGLAVLLISVSSGSPDEVRLGGHLVSCPDGNGTVTMTVTWALPNITLAPSVLYRLTLASGVVVVTQGV